VLNSVLSVPYYFGIIRNMFFEEPTADASRAKGAGAVRFSVYALAVATTLFIFFVGPLSALARSSGLL
jgi:NADH:ubiquinone oxidoreductase subunit 2 (subunit N)